MVYSHGSAAHTGLLRTNFTAFLIVGKELPRLMASIVIARTAATVVSRWAGLEMKKYALGLHAALVRTAIATHSTILQSAKK